MDCNHALDSLPESIHTTFKDCMQLIENQDITLIPDFITEEEERQIIMEIEPYMSRLRYEYSHWDDVSLIFILCLSML